MFSVTISTVFSNQLKVLGCVRVQIGGFLHQCVHCHYQYCVQQSVEGVGVWLHADRRLLAAACSLSLSVLCAVFNSWLKVLGCGCVQIGDFLQQRVRCEYCGEEASLVEHRDSTALSAHRNFLYHKSHSVQGREALVTRVCVCVCESAGRWGGGGGGICVCG